MFLCTVERGQASALFRDLISSSSRRAAIRWQTNLLMRDCSQPSTLNIHPFLAKYIIENQLDIITSLNKISFSLTTKEIFSLSLLEKCFLQMSEQKAFDFWNTISVLNCKRITEFARELNFGGFDSPPNS